MKKTKNGLLICLCAFVLSNCAPIQKNFIPLPEKVQQEIGSTEVYLGECEKKMQADIERSNLNVYAGGGLLFALVDSAIMVHREDCANEAMADMHKECELFNFQEKVKDKLVHTLRNTNWLHVRQINDVKTLDTEAHEAILKKENNDCILIGQFNYKLNPALSVLNGTLYLTLYPTSPKMKKMVKAENPLETPIFKFHVSATEALPHAGEDIQENAKMWAQNNGSSLKKALDNIIHQVFINLDKVLKHPNHLSEDS